MPFKDPSISEYFEPESGKYIARMIDLTDGDDFGNGPTMLWNMNLADAKGPILDPIDGEPVRYQAMSSSSLGKKSKGRAWAEGFLGKSIDDMTGQEVADALPGSIANVLIGPELDSKGQYRQRILSVEPFKADAPARPAPKREPVGSAAAGPNPFDTPA